jgi:hypothetical protein
MARERMKKDLRSRSTRLTLHFWALVFAWTVIVAGLAVSDAIHIDRAVREMAIAEARVHFNKDQAIRFWASSHGGVYVPVSDQVPPNPFLSHVPERDIQTPTGKSLTLMNPAYMSAISWKTPLSMASTGTSRASSFGRRLRTREKLPSHEKGKRRLSLRKSVKSY